jgi:hypothetical protein
LNMKPIHAYPLDKDRSILDESMRVLAFTQDFLS